MSNHLPPTAFSYSIFKRVMIGVFIHLHYVISYFPEKYVYSGAVLLLLILEHTECAFKHSILDHFSSQSKEM